LQTFNAVNVDVDTQEPIFTWFILQTNVVKMDIDGEPIFAWFVLQTFNAVKMDIDGEPIFAWFVLQTFNAVSREKDEELTCEDYDHFSFAQLQYSHGSYGINWTALVLDVLGLQTTKDVILCDVQLSKDLQHLLDITPPKSLWEFVLLHSLLHSDLFLLVSGHYGDGPHVGFLSGISGGAGVVPSLLNRAAAKTTLETREEELRVRSQEDQCLDLVEYVMPNVKSAVHCNKDMLRTSSKETDTMLEHLRSALFGILKNLFHISTENTWKITNTTVNQVKLDALFYLKSLEMDHYDAFNKDLDEYDFSGNTLELVKFRNMLYFSGKVHSGAFSADSMAFGIRSCFGGKLTFVFTPNTKTKCNECLSHYIAT
jgi:hypothetical protein